MKFWCVSNKYFDSGKVKVSIFPVEAETKLESRMTESCHKIGLNFYPYNFTSKSSTSLIQVPKVFYEELARKKNKKSS